ncbi:hypothetical protein PBY51_003886 [Eleginops maclovinus]|uniref:Uncharacterized protein n=1 Tax=Eleginops maclovinus TaxID=56733 RepID=A0AAN8AWU0_ELEMC|nr:hypothetical protein PBY51_003886 [Eleginops maclovinus]
MKLNPLSLLCLSLLLFHYSMAKRGGSFGKSFGFGSKKGSTPNRGNTNSNTGNKNNQGSNLRVDTPDSLDKPIRAVTPHSQADRAIQVVTPVSRLEATLTSTQQGAPPMEEVMEVDILTETQTTKS